MSHYSTLMGQLLQLIPRHVFDHLVNRQAWQGPNPRKFTYWSHLGSMLFGQWSARKSLRDLVFSLNRQVRKFYDLGLAAVPRSTLADGAWTCGRCLAFDLQITDNHRYSISVPESSENKCQKTLFPMGEGTSDNLGDIE